MSSCLLIKFGAQFKSVLIILRPLHDQMPPYISELLHPYVPARSLRSADHCWLYHDPEDRMRLPFGGCGPQRLLLDQRSVDTTVTI